MAMSHQMMQRDTREGPRPPSAQFSFRLQSQFRAAMPRWSLYGAPWSQPAAISRKSSEPQDRKNKPNPLPPGATGWLRPSMVRRGSPVRVRKRACKEAASRSFSFRLDLHDCQRTVGVEHFMEPSGQNAVVKRDDFARSASTRGVARGDGSTCRARAPLGSAPTSDLKGRRRSSRTSTLGSALPISASSSPYIAAVGSSVCGVVARKDINERTALMASTGAAASPILPATPVCGSRRGGLEHRARGG